MVSTRLFFCILFMSIALAGCQSLAAPWLAERPTPTPTPLPPAEETALSFLQAWEKEDYTAMYALLTPTAQKRSSRADFEERYHAALIEATVTAVRTRLNSLLQDGTRAEAAYHQTWETALFQPIEADNRLLLRFEMGRWGVDWSSTNILPVLGAGVTLRRLGEPLPRGNIYDRSGLGLAVQGTAVTLGVVPAQIADETTLLGQLARITGLSASAIRQKYINAPPNWFVPIADISFETSQANDGILSTLAGVERRARYVRLYPGEMLAAHLLGYMGYIPQEELSVWQTRGYRGDELVGRSGIEGWGEVYLAGQRGARLVAFAQDGRELAQFGERPPTSSKSLYLTIDRRLQQAAEAALGERLGAVVVLDPNNGEVLALASYPRFDPNHFAVGISPAEWAAFSQDPTHPLLNRATQGIYPPGSVFKIVTMAAALEKGGMTPETTFECTGTWEGLGKGFVKTCWLPTGHGTLDLVTALTVSCDVTFYEVGKRLYALDQNLLPSYARAFGLGSLTGLEGVSEVAGMVPDDAWKRSTLGEPWYPGDGVNLAVGQGYLLVTPLQMANMLAAVGNGGTLYRPRLIARIGDAPGRTTQLEEAEGELGPQVLGKLPVSPEHLAAIRQGLAGVTGGQRGTARAAFVGASFTSAGKTGTAESGGKEPHSWFVGYAPAENPRVAVAVVVENGGEGATVAAPIFRQVVEAFFAMF
jgi:penicillin-binding protein 2